MAVGYYVTIVRDKRVRYLAGPFDLPPTIQQVEAMRKLANDYDPWTHFDWFGTAKLEADTLPKGIFQ